MKVKLTALLYLLLISLAACPALADEPAAPPAERVLSLLNDVQALHRHGHDLMAVSAWEEAVAAYDRAVAGRLTTDTVAAPLAVYLLEDSDVSIGTAQEILYNDEAGMLSAAYGAETVFASDMPDSYGVLLCVTDDMPYFVGWSSSNGAVMMHAWLAPVEGLLDCTDPDELLTVLAPYGVTSLRAVDWPENVTPAPRAASQGDQLADMARVEALIARMDADCREREPEVTGLVSSMWVDENGQFHFGQPEVDREAYAAMFDRSEPRLVLHSTVNQSDAMFLSSLADASPYIDWYLSRMLGEQAAQGVTGSESFGAEASFTHPHDVFYDLYPADEVAASGMYLLLYEDAFPVVVSWYAENGAVLLSGSYASYNIFKDCETMLDVLLKVVELTRGQVDYSFVEIAY